jgi:hypothetical protein
MENSNNILDVKGNIDRLRQYNLTTELIEEYELLLLNSSLTEIQVNTLTKIIERMITQHYVKQLLMQNL